MAKVISEVELKKIIEEGVIVKGGAVSSVGGVKYDFRLGNRFIKSGYNTAVDFDTLKKDNKEIIEPGEVIYALSEEILNLPKDIKILLHDKRKLSHEGISVFGGGSVDPRYEGRLFFGLQNLSGKKFILKPGRKLKGATFYRLLDDEVAETSEKPEKMFDFPDDLEKFVENYKPINSETIYGRLDRLEESDKKIDESIDSINDNIKGLREDVRKDIGSLSKIVKGIGLSIIVAVVLYMLRASGLLPL